MDQIWSIKLDRYFTTAGDTAKSQLRKLTILHLFNDKG